MKYSVCFVVLVMCISFSGCQTHPTMPIAASAQSTAGVFSVGTLCSVGAFECEVAPSYARIASLTESATSDFRKGKLSTDQLRAVVNKGRAAVVALDGVMATCKQDAHTGRCLGDEVAARSQLAAAKRAVESLR